MIDFLLLVGTTIGIGIIAHADNCLSFFTATVEFALARTWYRLLHHRYFPASFGVDFRTA